MAHHKSAKKRIKTNEKRRQINKASISAIRTLTKKVMSEKGKAAAEVVLKETVALIDKTVAKGRIHKNTAARKKSSLTKHVNSLS